MASSVPPASTPAAAPGAAPRSAASRLFDIRLLIGALFLLYGVMLTVAGFFVSASARAKADGININLWLGLSMLVVGVLFVLWRWLAPLDHLTSALQREHGDDDAEWRRG